MRATLSFLLIVGCNPYIRESDWEGKCLKRWWPGTELNRRRQPFQGCALPPELPGHFWAHSLSAGAGRVMGHARTWTELPNQFRQSECWKHFWNSHDYSNGPWFSQIVTSAALR